MRAPVKRELVVTANGTDRSVTIEGPLENSRFRVAIDGAERLVDARSIRPGTWSLVIDGRSYVVDLDPRRAGIAASVAASDVVLQVAPGTAVIVLEAMKMENELVAERGGTVSTIHKTAGQAVDTGDLLIDLA